MVFNTTFYDNKHKWSARITQLEKTTDVSMQLKEAADATANVLKMRVTEPVEQGNIEAVTLFMQYL